MDNSKITLYSNKTAINSYSFIYLFICIKVKKVDNLRYRSNKTIWFNTKS